MVRRILRIRKIKKLYAIVNREVCAIQGDGEPLIGSLEAGHIYDTLKFRNKLAREYNAIKFSWQPKMFIDWKIN
jgi:hypothetical protein